MPNLRQKQKLNREQAFLKFCQSPKTIEDMMKEFGVVYNTAWRYCQDLAAKGLLKTTGQTKDRKILFVAGKPTVIPQLWNSFTEENWPLMQVVASGKPGTETASAVAARDFICYVIRIMREVEADNLAALARIKAEMLKSYAIMAATTGMYEQLLREDKLWDADGIKAIRHSSDFDRSVVSAAYDRYLAYATGKEGSNNETANDG